MAGEFLRALPNEKSSRKKFFDKYFYRAVNYDCFRVLKFFLTAYNRPHLTIASINPQDILESRSFQRNIYQQVKILRRACRGQCEAVEKNILRKFIYLRKHSEK